MKKNRIISEKKSGICYKTVNTKNTVECEFIENPLILHM